MAITLSLWVHQKKVQDSAMRFTRGLVPDVRNQVAGLCRKSWPEGHDAAATIGRCRPAFQYRSSMNKSFAVSLLSLSVALALQPALAADAPKFNPKRLSDEVKTLASDEFEGRGPATAGETKTVDYVVAQMKAAGLQPGGDLKDGKRAWTQAVPLLRAEIVGAPTLSVSNAGKAQPLTQGEQIAVR
ncbi:MAG TPA: hypothetical protein VGQ93_07210, partial [Lysobacter sp.]|nr:hypothetical protein [Lysobacter sp.]